MKICHISDTHGAFPPLPDCDLVVHSGDFMPNRTRGIRPVEETFQTEWLRSKLRRTREWLGDRPLYFCPGNHDFVDPTVMWREAGLTALNLELRQPEFGGLVFAGFPWVPYFTGEWNYETSEAEIGLRLEQLRPCDVLVCHGPPKGVQDRNGNERCGSWALRSWCQTNSWVPKYLLCGHIHTAFGSVKWLRGITVVNSATKVRLIDI